MDISTKLELIVTSRHDDSEIEHQKNVLLSNTNFVPLIDALPHNVMMLNQQMQIVWANLYFLKSFKKSTVGEIQGSRPGEVLHCINVTNSERGCGSSPQCRVCGALKSIIESFEGQENESECIILTTENEALNLLFKAKLIEIAGEFFNCVSVVDTSFEVNKRILERLFFHDVMNFAGSIQGYTDVLPTLIEEDKDSFFNALNIISDSTGDLIELIKCQKDLLSAENNELSVHPRIINAKELLSSVKHLFGRNPIFSKRRIDLHELQNNFSFTSDPRLLKRVIVNTVKNALEAIDDGETVSLKCQIDSTHIVFEIHNNSYIPDDVQSQIFRKSFSTKSPDRGIGTYSIKLFTEKYLAGRVWFESTKATGTTFYIKIRRDSQ